MGRSSLKPEPSIYPNWAYIWSILHNFEGGPKLLSRTEPLVLVTNFASCDKHKYNINKTNKMHDSSLFWGFGYQLLIPWVMQWNWCQISPCHHLLILVEQLDSYWTVCQITIASVDWLDPDLAIGNKQSHNRDNDGCLLHITKRSSYLI